MTTIEKVELIAVLLPVCESVANDTTQTQARRDEFAGYVNLMLNFLALTAQSIS